MQYEIIDDFLPQFDTLLDEYPTMFAKEVRGHGDIYQTDPEFNMLSKGWQQFYQHVHTESFWLPLIKKFNIKTPPFRSAYREPRNGLHQPLNELFTYARCDVSLGLEGYGKVNGGRGRHVDNPNRIISALLYFTDQEEIQGGEFVFTDLPLIVPLKKNRLVASTQTKDAWHKVNPVTKGQRKSVYMALSCSQPFYER